MENTNTTPFKKFDIPVKMGFITALVGILTFTLGNMLFIKNFVPYIIFLIVSFILVVIMLGVTGAQQRKAMGGYIEFKEAFQAIFVAILILCVCTFVYSEIYTHFIDPHFSDKMKESSLRFAEKMGATQEALDEAAKKADEGMAQKNNISNKLLSLFWSVVIYSIFGFICAAIVKKKRPENAA
jgi:hypothetical protein